MEKRQFLYNLCSKALRLDNSITFVGVVNNVGKLIAGISRQFVAQKSGAMEDDFLKPALSFCYIFRNNVDRIWSRKSVKVMIAFGLEISTDFQLLDLRNNAYIAFTPLTEIHDKYLCIYLESDNVESSTLMNLNAIFDLN